MNTIFKEKRKNNNKLLDLKYCEQLDENTKLIPLYFKPVFNKIFSKREFLKKFLILELDLDKSLEKQNTFYGKSLIYNNYAPYVVKTSVIVNIDDCKIPFTFTKIDYQNKGLHNKIYELNLNNERKNETKIKENENFKRVRKNIGYYRNLYDRGVMLDEKSLLLVILTSSSFKELYEILIKIFDEKETSNIIKEIHHLSTNIHIIKKWEKYQKFKNIGKLLAKTNI